MEVEEGAPASVEAAAAALREAGHRAQGSQHRLEVVEGLRPGVPHAASMPAARSGHHGDVQVLVLSDTHLTATTLDRMPEEVWGMADDADVVLHAGDVVDAAVLHALSDRATVHAVLGNNDRGIRLPEVLQVELAGVPVAMVHDSGPRAGRERRLVRRFPQARVVVFGHSHMPLVQDGEGGQLLVNPGSPTQRRRQPVHTVAVLDLHDGEVVAGIVEVGPLASATSRRS